MRLYDTHCHLTTATPAEADPPAAQLQRARAAGVARCLCVATDLESSRASRALAQAQPDVLASAGIHPNDLGQDLAAARAALEQLAHLLDEGGFAAVGETGLDFYRDWCPPEIQRLGLRAQLALARRHGLPVILHCRNAAPALLEELQEQERPVRGVMHCYSEGPEPLPRFLELGLHISFAGNLSYPKADAIRAAALLVPEERLLVETDAPFLAPQPVRGRRNEPAYVAHTLEFLARLRGAAPEALAERTWANAEALFGPRSTVV